VKDEVSLRLGEGCLCVCCVGGSQYHFTIRGRRNWLANAIFNAVSDAICARILHLGVGNESSKEASNPLLWLSQTAGMDIWRGDRLLFVLRPCEEHVIA